MTQTLRQIIANKDFAGYQVSDAGWRLSSEEIEDAIYGSDGVCGLDHDLAETFCKDFDVDLVAVNTWLCTDTEVGLEVVRMKGEPVALLWQPARKARRQVSFLSPEALEAFRSAWEAAKQVPEAAGLLVPSDILDMPLAAPGAAPFDIEGDALPSLSLAGAQDWIKAEGGLEDITDKPALAHVAQSFARSLKDRDAVLAELRGITPAPEMEEVIERELGGLQEARDELERRLGEIRDRLLQIP